MSIPLSELFEPDEFVRRHVGPSLADVDHMLAVLGAHTLDGFVDATMPASIRSDRPLGLPDPVSETDALTRLAELAAKNRCVTSLIGMGYTNTITPPVIARNVLENPAWYTAYTPYQPEISQGRLEALLNFQTVVTELTGLDVANASLLDEGTAAAEAMTMARRLSKVDSQRFFVHHDIHPQTLAVLRTRAEPVGVELVVGDTDVLAATSEQQGQVFGVLVSNPGSHGNVVDWTTTIDRAHELGAIAAVITDPLACVLLRSPGAMGADIAVGSTQRFGVPMGFGGPHAAFIAARDSASRSLPGRLVGVSTDTAGRPALRLALQTREQHIRREKATSNICTAQVLLANIAGFYAVWHGRAGLRRIAERVNRLTSVAAAGLVAGGLQLRNPQWFDTVVVTSPDRDADALVASALEAGFNIRRVDDVAVGVTFDETSTLDMVSEVVQALGGQMITDPDSVDGGIPASLCRTDDFLTQSVFERYQSEHEMLRYIKRLADRDLALDRTMIPLGSCTMKLNSTSEMMPISWREFSDLHPFVPSDQAAGYLEMIGELESKLATITGYDAVSVQPNAGSQGEFAGLLAIRAYHRANGADQRTVCLIPSSAHGTNAASAVMAGLEVRVVNCDHDGNIDLDDLKAQITAVGDRLAAIMVTYPSTHGVFEPAVVEMCGMVHDAGGQVYVDGANLNALVGLAQPGKFGADVSHLNLHKTFCIPHGGGGPGVGPIGVRAHLAPYLPGHPLDGDAPVGAVASAPFGSAGILPIPWMYLEMMGGSGLTTATRVAVLAANYIAARLDQYFPVLYHGAEGRVAHECILDVREITKTTGVTVDDIAKRLMDYGFHAPTMSFPVAGTLMVEPTESETLREIDRFCDAMIAIRGEIDAVARGEWALHDSPLRHAPHTSEELVGDWDRPYSRELGAFPLDSLRVSKYFTPVSRIDGAYGDRNLICSCEPLEALAT